MVYGCDAAWWKHRKGLPEFKGRKVAWDGDGLDYPDRLKVRIRGDRQHGFSNQMLFGEIGIIGGGRNTGFQAVNLAAQLGAARILLIGFDMRADAGLHWYGRNAWSGANNPDEKFLAGCARILDAAAPVLGANGVEVINCSPVSALTAFPKLNLEAALDRSLDLDRLRTARG